MVCYTADISYVAISHVWSHGMGSTAEQGLPTCQLRKLKQMLARSGIDTSLIWIDSLCIPQDHSLKMASIGIMDQIYQNAESVLVVDAMLERYTSADASPEQLSLLAEVSEWNRRLWTFQEAKLAKRLQFAFQDAVVSITELRTRLRAKIEAYTMAAVSFSCLAILHAMASDETLLFSWLKCLRFRSCTDPDDEALIISTVCGFDTTSLAPLAGQLRTAKLWEMVGTVHGGILFHAFPKLDVDNFRWAPQSLRSARNEGGMTGPITVESAGYVTPDGLEADYVVAELVAPMQMPERRSVVGISSPAFNVRLYRRDADWDKRDGLVFDAVAFIRCPIAHVEILKSTPISAVALLRTGQGTGARASVPRYRLQYQLLGDIEVVDDGVRPARRRILVS